MKQQDILYCSFCGKSQNDVSLLIAGSNVYICNECIGISLEILEHHCEKESSLPHALTVNDGKLKRIDGKPLTPYLRSSPVNNMDVVIFPRAEAIKLDRMLMAVFGKGLNRDELP